jgi:beta-lysine 5,6-aminomutase beta subunit
MNKKSLLRPYGDTHDDGQIQCSFTLPTTYGRQAEEAAKKLLENMGLTQVRIAAARDLGNGFSFFVAYGRIEASVELDSVVVDDALQANAMDMHAVDELLAAAFAQPIVVVGACIGSDAHTVGIDAIMNMKGFAGDYGLERYHSIEAHNLGAQVAPEELVREAVRLHAKVILVSQVVTQKQIHLQQMTRLVELLEAEGVRDDFLLIAGGPQITHALAKELGYDAGFGARTLPSQVATYLAHRLIDQKAAGKGSI